MDIFESTIGAYHTVLALVALISGAYVVFQTKGTLTHKKVGYIYVASMLLMNVTALFTQVLFTFGPFHILAIFSLLTVLFGILSPLLFRHHGNWLSWHYAGMSWSYVGLWAAFAAEIVVRLPLEGLGVSFWQVVIGASLLITVLGGYYIKKHESSLVQSSGNKQINQN